MTYSKVQFVGYVIDTFPDDTRGYLGLANPQQDIEARCALMQRAIRTAADAVAKVSPQPQAGDVLTVFMAPEFFFRGAAGAYEMDEVQTAIAALQGLTADAAWDDWVFGFGTIVGKSSPTQGAPNSEIYNFALIQEGGVAASGPAGARVVMKELISDIDFLAMSPNPAGIVAGEVEAPASGPSGPGRETQRVAYDGAGIFSLRGLTWAADICLDHLDGRLIRSPQLPGEQQVQVQLVPSAGAQITPDGICTMPGGFVFNVDGSGNWLINPGQWRGADLQRIDNPPASLPSSGAFPVSADGLTLNSTSPVVDVAVSQLYRNGPGQIILFSVQPIPAAQLVPGTRKVLAWPASDDYTFEFNLIYDASQKLTTVLVAPQGGKVNFNGHSYFLPLAMNAIDRQGQPISIEAKRLAGTGGYDLSIWCRIKAPGFIFEGLVLQADATLPGKPVDTIW
jgi:hypothetical protein